jgi:hypothetical protein
MGGHPLQLSTTSTLVHWGPDQHAIPLTQGRHYLLPLASAPLPLPQPSSSLPLPPLCHLVLPPGSSVSLRLTMSKLIPSKCPSRAFLTCPASHSALAVLLPYTSGGLAPRPSSTTRAPAACAVHISTGSSFQAAVVSWLQSYLRRAGMRGCAVLGEVAQVPQAPQKNGCRPWSARPPHPYRSYESFLLTAKPKTSRSCTVVIGWHRDASAHGQSPAPAETPKACRPAASGVAEAVSGGNARASKHKATTSLGVKVGRLNIAAARLSIPCIWGHHQELHEATLVCFYER